MCALYNWFLKDLLNYKSAYPPPSRVSVFSFAYIPVEVEKGEETISKVSNDDSVRLEACAAFSKPCYQTSRAIKIEQNRA